ncbi:hypothetical protein BD626DRAFT_515321 [Schizophyllum amplum]|uniref:Uncharacterized protein n=1 Tax=Schizophyllum amplum TaxID=97359 RepID=A0A550BXN7_9AGAR|nr:hypothetical protein BD626DRAFT_515321 [Auriculariopsis ampla]
MLILVASTVEFRRRPPPSGYPEGLPHILMFDFASYGPYLRDWERTGNRTIAAWSSNVLAQHANALDVLLRDCLSACRAGPHDNDALQIGPPASPGLRRLLKATVIPRRNSGGGKIKQLDRPVSSIGAVLDGLLAEDCRARMRTSQTWPKTRCVCLPVYANLHVDGYISPISDRRKQKMQ